jgi:parvulin-like peptidyl-prolyl isomerase
MSLRRPLALIALAATALALAACGGGSSTSKPDVPSDAIGVVGTQTILKKDFDHQLSIALLSMKSQGQTVPKPGTAEYVKTQSSVVYELFQIAIVKLEAQKQGIKLDTAKAAASLKSLQATPAYAKALKDQGLTAADVVELVNVNQLGGALMAKATKSLTPVTDAAIKANYDANRETTYKTPESRSVQHILLGPAGGATPKAADFPALLTKANQVLAQLRGGADFTKLVKKYSTDPGKTTNDGKYPNVNARDYQPEFAAASMKLKTGAYTLVPVKTVFGYHIIKALADTVPAGYQTFDAVKAQIKQQLESKASSDAASVWFKALIAEYVAKSSFAAGYALPASATAPVSTGTSTK